MHDYGSSRVERVCYGVFQGKTNSDHSHSQTLGSDEGDDVGCSDGAEAMIGGKIDDEGGGIAFLVAQVSMHFVYLQDRRHK